MTLSDLALSENALLREAADALMELLNDTQHKRHPNCEDGGYCPVRDARRTLAKLQAHFARKRGPALATCPLCQLEGSVNFLALDDSDPANLKDHCIAHGHVTEEQIATAEQALSNSGQVRQTLRIG
jgi:Zn ribbon nucleic-acid-binding protein